MSSSIFVDSSILVEYYKGTKTELLETLLLEIPETRLFICQTTLSEYFFQCLKIDSGKAPLTVKSSGKIAETLSASDHKEFLSLFDYLSDEESLRDLCPEMMSKYNLLPNDALILSICKLNGINVLASYDANDFQVACAAEGIILLQSSADLEVLKQ
jgi:uncharacterized protein